MSFVWWLTTVIIVLVYLGLGVDAIKAYRARTGALIMRSIMKGRDDG